MEIVTDPFWPFAVAFPAVAEIPIACVLELSSEFPSVSNSDSPIEVATVTDPSFPEELASWEFVTPFTIIVFELFFALPIAFELLMETAEAIVGAPVIFSDKILSQKFSCSFNCFSCLI